MESFPVGRLGGLGSVHLTPREVLSVGLDGYYPVVGQARITVVLLEGGMEMEMEAETSRTSTSRRGWI